jgi:hypothetical protein
MLFSEEASVVSGKWFWAIRDKQDLALQMSLVAIEFV